MSPVKITKVKGGFQVKTPDMIHAKHTTKAKAEAQERLLNAVEHTNWRPTGKPSMDSAHASAVRRISKK